MVYKPKIYDEMYIIIYRFFEKKLKNDQWKLREELVALTLI